jgi:hypothetical protein
LVPPSPLFLSAFFAGGGEVSRDNRERWVHRVPFKSGLRPITFFFEGFDICLTALSRSRSVTSIALIIPSSTLAPSLPDYESGTEESVDVAGIADLV